MTSIPSRYVLYVVDDDIEDREVLEEELKKSRGEYELHFFNSCVELADYHDQREEPDSPKSILPSLTLMTGFPKTHSLPQGIDILQKAPGLRAIPLVLMVCTRSEETYLHELQLPVAGVLVKPVVLEKLQEYLLRWGRGS